MLETVTVGDCHELVKQIPDVSAYKLISYQLKPLCKKSGFLGEYYILHMNLHCQANLKELRFFVKSMSEVESQRNFIYDSGAFFKEEKMFERIAPNFLDNDIFLFAECMPKCFLTRSMKLFIFEDLSCQGYKTLNHRESFDLAETKVALNAITKFHAPCLILEEKLSRNSTRPYRMPQDYHQEFVEMFYKHTKLSTSVAEAAKKGVLTHIDLFPDPNSNLCEDVFKDMALRSVDRVREYVKPSSNFRNTICHGDLWASNMMFKFNKKNEPVHCRIVDFQSYRYCPPAQDVMAFLYLSTDRKFRELHMKQALDYYYAQLKEILRDYDIKLEDVISYEEYLESCEFYKEFAITQEVMHFEGIMMSSDQLLEFFKTPGYSQKILFENRSELIVRQCETDPVYKMKQLESITDLREICEKII